MSMKPAVPECRIELTAGGLECDEALAQRSSGCAAPIGPSPGQ
jgi:hypothetical protein